MKVTEIYLNGRYAYIDLETNRAPSLEREGLSSASAPDPKGSARSATHASASRRPGEQRSARPARVSRPASMTEGSAIQATPDSQVPPATRTGRSDSGAKISWSEIVVPSVLPTSRGRGGRRNPRYAIVSASERRNVQDRMQKVRRGR